MIESLHIRGFKLFRDLTLPKLGRLNLFVGENNTGKSCLLEAINLYAGRNPLTDVLQTAAARSAHTLRPWEPNGFNEEGSALTHPIFELFQRAHRGILAAQFIIEKIGDSSPLRVESQPYQIVTNEEGLRRYVRMAEGDAIPESVEMALPVYRGGKQVGLITRRLLPLRRTADNERFSNGDASIVAFLPARGLSDEKAASMWDALVQGPGQEMVLDWLRMLDSRIGDLAYIAGRFQSRLALLKMQGEGRIPLRSMGDGLTKLFHIALSVASAPKGILLIDEFENGLHWSVQRELWGALAKAARDVNVQIFATTHSRDCIEAFTAAAKEAAPGAAFIYRLERDGDDILANSLPLLNVDAAMREREEVR